MKNAVTQRWAVSSPRSRRKERIAVLLLCAIAAARVFLFSAAFPFFNNVDERRHFDLVMKYASGHLPRGAELISPASLPYLSRYASPEFLTAPENFEGGYYGPPGGRDRADARRHRRDLGPHSKPGMLAAAPLLCSGSRLVPHRPMDGCEGRQRALLDSLS